MYETYQEAIDALSELTKNGTLTEAQLDDFIANVSRHSTGSTTILYSGADADVYELLKAHPDSRMIGKTISAKILESDEFKIAKAHSMGLEDASSIDERNPPSRLNKAFNDIGGEWDTLSRRFVSETHGQVYGLTGVAPPERIWAKTEIFEALKRAEVPMIEGIPRTTLTQVRDDLVTAGKYATPDDATFAVRAKVSMQADDNLRNSMVGVDADGKVKWIDTERLTNGALRNLPKPPELTYTLYAEHFDRKQAAALASDNPKTVQYALEKQAIQRTNPQVVAESIESLRTLPPTPTRQAAIDAMAHQGSTKGIYTAESASLKVTAADIANPQIQKLGGLPRTDLAAMSDELISKHGYTQTKALEAVNARVTVQTALEEVRAGKPLVLTDELNRSYNTLSETERVLRHTPHGAELNKQVTAFTQATNGANDLVQHTLTAPATPMRQPLTAPNLKAEDLTQEVKTTKPNNHVTIQTNGVYAAEHKYSVEKLAQDQAKYEQAVKLQQELRNPATNMAAERKIVAETAHLGASIESGLSKVAGKALAGVGVIDAAVTISNDVEAAQRTANNRKEELTKGTAAFSKGVMQESGVDLAISAVDAVSRLNPVSTIQRMVDNQTLNPLKGIGDEVQKNAQAREAAYTQFGETTGNSLYNSLSKEGSAKTEADKLTQAIPNITDPEARKTAETLRDAFAQTAHEEHLKNQNRIAGVHGVMNSYDDFIAKNPRYTDISKDDVVDETNKLTGNGMAAHQAVSTGYNNLKQQLDTENAERLAKLSPADREATLKVMERNPSASVRTASELVELANNRGMTTMGGAPIGENMYKAALAKMEEANYKADPTYGKDPRDIALQQQADKQRALEQAKQHIRDVVQTMSIDQKMAYYKAQAVEQRKDPNHYAHPHDAASTLVHLQYAKAYQERQAKRTQIDDYKESHGQTKSPTEPPAVHRPVAKPHEMGIGAHGANVKGVQTALNALGANIAVDGHYGKSTVEAAKAFQREHHLKIDGTIGVKDAKVMMNAIEREHIKNAQTLLNDLGADLKVNGHMDKATVAAVKEFQTEHQLKATGKLDTHTTDAISKAVHVQHEQTRTVEPVMTQTITTPPANQPDVVAPTTPAVSPEQNKQVEQMVSTLSATNPTFAALAPDVQMTMAAQMMEAAQAVNIQPQVQVQPQAQTVTAQVQNTPEPITQTAVPTMAQAEPQPVMATPVQSLPAYVAPAMPSPTVATAEVEPPARQVENVPQSAQPIVLPRNLASLHAQLTEKFGNQLDHLSEKDQQTTIALATLEAAKFHVRTVDQIFISPKGDVLMSFDQQRTCSGDINLAQVPNYDANQVLAETISLQQSQQQAIAQRQSQSQGGPTMTV